MKTKNVETQKRTYMKPPMSAKQRKQKFVDSTPDAEARQKARERQRDSVMRFHIVRNHVSGIPIPDSVDSNSSAFKRVLREYNEQCEQKVEVVA